MINDTDVVTWSGRKQEDKNKEIIHVKDFGAIGDGITDDTIALSKAMLSGKTIFLGDNSCIYKVTREIGLSLTTNLEIYSNGATLLATTKMRSMVRISASENSISIKGKLIFKANRYAFTGLYIQTPDDTSKFSTLSVEDIEIYDCYRQDKSWTGGDGVFIAGGFHRVNLRNIIINGIYMAKDAGISGSQGVSGITVIRCDQVVVDNFYIKDVVTEDLNYTADQDAIRVFTKHSQDNILPTNNTSIIKNGVIIDIPGRAIKSQCELIMVEKITVFNNSKNFIRGYGNPTFDFQTGGGNLRDCKLIYKDFLPQAFIYMYASESIVKSIGTHLGNVDGLDVSIEMSTPSVMGNPVIRLVTNHGCDFGLSIFKNIRVRGVNIKLSHLLTVVRTGDKNPPKNLTVKIEDCVLPISDYLMTAQDQFVDTGLRAILSNIINTADPTYLIDTNSSVSKARWSSIKVLNLLGFISANVGDSTLPAQFVNAIEEYSEFVIEGDRRGGGSMRLTRSRLSKGENTFDLSGFVGYVNSNLVLLNIAKSRESIAILFVDKNGIKPVFVGSDISIGGNMPSTIPALFDIWVTNNNFLNITNNFGTTYLTSQFLG